MQSSNQDQENKFLLDEDQIEELRKNAIERVKKQPKKWVQRGPYLVCVTEDGEFAIHIGTDQLLTGFEEDGTPRLERITMI